jgi:predicted flap endonuclease-1-like 5' DNA nuclease
MKCTARVCGIFVVAIAATAGLLLFLKSRSGPPRIPLDQPSPFRAAEPEPAGPDDLSDVKGIGPVYAARLADAGMATFAQLASSDPQTVARHAGVSERAAADWITQASELATR